MKQYTSRRKDDAFETLVQRFTPLLYAAIRARVRAPADAEDILQETLLSIYIDLATLRNKSNPGPWMLKIARRRTVDFYRSKEYKIASRSEGISDATDSELHEVVENNPGPAESLLSKEKGVAIRNALDKLPERLKLVVYLKLWEGYSSAAIAEFLGLKESAVKMRLHRGLGKLRGHLSKHGFGPPGDAS